MMSNALQRSILQAQIVPQRSHRQLHSHNYLKHQNESTRLVSDTEYAETANTNGIDMECSLMQKYIGEFEDRQGKPNTQLCKYPGSNLLQVKK
jgi:hypothetical protein